MNNRSKWLLHFFVVMLVILSACNELPQTPAPSLLEPTQGQPTLSEPEPTRLPVLPDPDVIALTPDFNEQAAAMLPQEQADLPALIDYPFYELSVNLDYYNQTFTGRSQVHYTNRAGLPLDNLYFHLLPNGGASYGNGMLGIVSAAVEGLPVEINLLEGGLFLEIQLPAPLANGESTIVEIDFNGQVPKNFGGSGYGLYNYMDGVLTMTGWYPLLSVYDYQDWSLNPPSNIGDSVYAEAAFYAVEIEIEPNLVLAATGVEIHRERSGENMLYRFVSGPVREFALVMSPEFQVKSQVFQGTLINSYYLPGSEMAGQEALEIAGRSLEIFNRSFGVYPFAELNLAEVPLRYAAGVEFPGLVFLHRNAYLNGPAPYLEDLVAHEVAHQWWYNVVGNDVFENPWLDEALATYSSAIYLETSDGSDAYQQQMEQYREGYERLVRSGRDEPVAESLAYFETGGRSDRYGPVVYSKGALFLHVLREEIGDDAFFAALQAYYQAMKYQIALPEDLLGKFQAQHPNPLDDLYQEWLYSTQ